MKTIVFDLDGVIATGTVEEVYSNAAGWAYEKCKPIQSTIDAMCILRSYGFRLVVHTARWESDRKKTEAWLEEYGVPYHELRLDKPSAVVYVDDRNYPSPFVPSDDPQALASALMVQANGFVHTNKEDSNE